MLDLGLKNKIRHKVVSARIVGIVITFAIFFGGLWCSANLRENGIMWFGLSPEWTGRLGAAMFLFLFLIVMKNFGDTFVYGWVKDQKDNNEDTQITKEN